MEIISFDKNWDFSYSAGTAALDKTGKAYKKIVDLPHDFMISTERTDDARTEGAGGFFQGGIGTYEKHFTISSDKKEKQFILLFEGSYGNTEVWLNGNMVTLHHYGYTEFYVNITRWLKFDEDNKLKVVVENNALPNSRWYSGSGLYRHVWMLEGGSVYLGPWSVCVKTPSLDTVEVSASITNSKEPLETLVSLTIYDADGNTVISQSKDIFCEAGITDCTFTVKNESFIPWTLDNPYLYTAKTSVCGDEKTVTFGVRTISFSRKGFFLNGINIKLRGGCIHHDNGVAGACAYAAMEERKVLQLKESGYNAIRTSHNPMSTALLDACDRYGVLVLDECFDCWRAKKNPFDYHLYFEKFWKEDLASMVLRDRNHPSVIMYSIGNEIGERDGSGDGAKISNEMCKFVRNIDNTRAITNGVCAVFLDAGEFGGILANIFGSGETVDFESLPDEVKGFLAQADYVKEHWAEITAPFIKDLDVAGYNYLDDRYEKDGKDFPERIIVGTESYPNNMKQVWERTMAHPYVIGDFTWTAYDYLGESGIGHAFYNQSGGLFCDYPFHTGNCGDYDLCGFLRPQGKFRRLLWDMETGPVITVLKPKHFGKKEAVSTWGWPDVEESWTWPGFEGHKVRLDIYSKAQEAEIIINGKSSGRMNVPDSWILQADVIYEPGTIEVIEYNNGVKGASNKLVTSGQTAALKASTAKTDTADVIIIEIEAVDTDGRHTPDYTGTIYCTLDDNTVLAGMGSADPCTEENYTTGRCRMFNGRALLVVKKITDTAASIEIAAKNNAIKKVCVKI